MEKFEDVTGKSGVGWAGEAAAGAGWFDYDNDGDLDLYVLNGLWTGPGDQDMSSLFSRAYTSELLIEQTDLERAQKAHSMLMQNFSSQPWFQQHGHSDLDPLQRRASSTESSTPSDVPSLSLGGNQRNVLFRNNGDGTFTELAFLAGVDTIDDGYMPAFADMDKDGKVDLLVRSCDPGTPQYQYHRLHCATTRTPATMPTISLPSRCKATELTAIVMQLAQITLTVGDTTMVREIDTVAGAVQVKWQHSSDLVLQIPLTNLNRLAIWKS